MADSGDPKKFTDQLDDLDKRLDQILQDQVQWCQDNFLKDE
jgi:hypothetical protein